MFAEKGDTYRIGKTLKIIQRTCDDCHTVYQPLVTAMYRSPHYDDVMIRRPDDTEQAFDDNMEDLSVSVNRILIALDDGHRDTALQASRKLAAQLEQLDTSCDHCHENDAHPRERILGEHTRRQLDELHASIATGQVKESQKLMGEIAVNVCARCQNTHRIVYDLRNALLPDK